jgi:transposase
MTYIPYVPRNFDIFIGIDTDKHRYSFTVKDQAVMSRSKTIPADPKQMYNYIRNHFADKHVVCAYEAGPTGFGLHDYLIRQRQLCFVVSPLSMPQIPNRIVKNNRLDSDKLAQELKSGSVDPIRVPEGPYRELRHLINLRENYARLQMTAKQRIKGLLLYTSLHTELQDSKQHWSNLYIQKLKAISCSPAERTRLNMLLMDLSYARQQQRIVLRQIRLLCNNDRSLNEHRQNLQTIPGIGFITAVTLLGRMGDPRLLRTEREIGAFVGVVPREHSTGDAVNRSSITHSGNMAMRTLLIEASWAAIRKDAELNAFFHRIKSRHHPKIAARKAIVAIARKLTLRIYRVLKEQRPYMVH